MFVYVSLRLCMCLSLCVFVCVVEDNSAGHATFSGEKLAMLSLEKDFVSFNPFGSCSLNHSLGS